MQTENAQTKNAQMKTAQTKNADEKMHEWKNIEEKLWDEKNVKQKLSGHARNLHNSMPIHSSWEDIPTVSESENFLADHLEKHVIK